MLGSIVVLLAFQLAGEVVVRALSLPAPGPVAGLALLAALLTLRPAIATYLAPTSRTILAHLSSLFVPAGVRPPSARTACP